MKKDPMRWFVISVNGWYIALIADDGTPTKWVEKREAATQYSPELVGRIIAYLVERNGTREVLIQRVEG